MARRKPRQTTTGRLQSLRLFSTLLSITLKMPGTPGQRAELILPCVTKKELATIMETLGKGDAERKDRALYALRHAKQIKLILTSEVATQEKERP